MDRRSVLAALGCSAAASPLATPMAFAALPSDARLVVVVLRGGMDGLAALQPHGAPEFARLRPDLALTPATGAVALTDFHAVHPALAPLVPLWADGHLGFAQAVATPYRDRSHFDGQDVLEAGGFDVPPPSGREGWLNRLLAAMPGATGRTAMAVGRDEMLILRGRAPHGTWAPDARLRLDQATADLLRHVHHDDPLLRDAVEEALRLSAESLRPDAEDGVERLFAFAAAQLRRDARIAALSLGGWDTHRGQHVGLTRPLGRLATGILRVRAELGADWDRTVVLAMTEFGRTVAQNGTRGTDHGTGGTLLLAGGALDGGRVWGDWPGLAEADLLDRRDLMPTRDVRAYAAWALRDLFGVGRATLERVVFPGLEMGRDPRLTA